MSRLSFKARGAATSVAIALARELGLQDGDAERVLGAILGALQPQATPPGTYPVPFEAAAAAATAWTAAATIEILGQHHGTVLLAGDKAPTTYRVGYRGLDGVVRLADNGEAAAWATQWWPLP